MKKWNIIFVLVLLITVSSCYSALSISNKQVMQIRKGMTQDELVALMERTPDYRRFENNTEEWEYRGYKDYMMSAVVVWFKNGRVDGMDFYMIQPPVAVVTPAPERSAPERPLIYPTPGHSLLQGSGDELNGV